MSGLKKALLTLTTKFSLLIFQHEQTLLAPWISRRRPKGLYKDKGEREIEKHTYYIYIYKREKKKVLLMGGDIIHILYSSLNFFLYIYISLDLESLLFAFAYALISSLLNSYISLTFSFFSFFFYFLITITLLYCMPTCMV